MSITLTYDGAAADLTLQPGDRLWVQSTSAPAAVQAIVYAGDAAVFTLPLDTAAWGTAFTLTRSDPRVGGRVEGVDGRLRAFRESSDAQRRQAIEAEARRQRAARVNYLRYPWR